MKQLTKRRSVNQRLKSQLDHQRGDASIVLDCYQQAMEYILQDRVEEAKRYADSAKAQLTVQTIAAGEELHWTRFLLVHCQAICSAAKEDYSRADLLLAEATTMASSHSINQALFRIVSESNTTAINCRAGRYREATRTSKYVLDNMDGINLTNKPNKQIMVAIRLLFEGMFHLLVGRKLPMQLHETILKAHNLSIVSNGAQHRLTRAIERCASAFGQENTKHPKKASTVQSETKELVLSKSHIRNSQSGCGSRLQLSKKNSTLRSKHLVGRSHDAKNNGMTNTTQTHRLRQTDDFGDSNDFQRNPFGSPFRKEKKELFQIYSGDKKKKIRSPMKRQQAEPQPEEMKELERIKRIYQPAHSNNRIEYSYQPGLLERTYKLEFLMLPVNKSLCLEDDKKDGLSRVVRNRNNLGSGHFEEKAASIRVKKNTEAFVKVRQSKAVPSKKNYRIGVKTKRNTQTPTLITLSSLEEVERGGQYDPSPTTYHRYPPNHSRVSQPHGQCGII